MAYTSLIAFRCFIWHAYPIIWGNIFLSIVSYQRASRKTIPSFLLSSVLANPNEMDDDVKPVTCQMSVDLDKSTTRPFADVTRKSYFSWWTRNSIHYRVDLVNGGGSWSKEALDNRSSFVWWKQKSVARNSNAIRSVERRSWLFVPGLDQALVIQLKTWPTDHECIEPSARRRGDLWTARTTRGSCRK